MRYDGRPSTAMRKAFDAKRKTTCVNGHDLTADGAVQVVQRTRNGRTYPERQCLLCKRTRARDWWRTNRSPRPEAAS